MGQKSSGDVGAAVATSGNTGDGTIGTISKGSAYKPGTYSVVFSGATAYEVFDPEGEVVAAMTSAGAFTSNDINFTFTTHTNAMVAGDSFTIQIAAGTGPYIPAVSGAATAARRRLRSSSTLPIQRRGGTLSGSACGVRADVYLSGEFNPNAITYNLKFYVGLVKMSLRAVSIYLKGAVWLPNPPIRPRLIPDKSSPAFLNQSRSAGIMSVCNIIPGPAPPSSVDDPQRQWPLLREVFRPDGLIASVADPVSDTVTVTGGLYLRGTVMGKTSAGLYRPAVMTATDGSQQCIAILAALTDATEGDVSAGVYLQGDFNSECLTLDPSISLLTAQAALRPFGIFVKGVNLTT